MKQPELKIITLNIDELTPYKNNAKLHPTEQIEQIKESIIENGFNDPIAIWGDNNIIVEGHGRYIALQELGIDKVPCIRLDHLTEEQRRAYTLTHNKLTMNSGFNEELLDLELDELQEIGVDVIGFEETETISPDDFGDDFTLPDGDKPDICQMTFTLHNEQAELIKYAMETVGECSETFGNTNRNGNAIYEVVKQWAEQKK